MDKFIHEKSRRRDLVKERGADPIWASIRKNDEYVRGKAAVEVTPFSDAVLEKSSALNAVGKTSFTPCTNPSRKTEAKAGNWKSMSRKEFSQTPEGLGLKGRALKKAHWDYLRRITERAESKKEVNPKETAIKTRIMTTNSFSKEFMAVKENRELVKKLRAEISPKPSFRTLNLEEGVADSLTQSAKTLFYQLLFSHPDTHISELKKISEFEWEAEIKSFNKVFVHELQRALVSYDTARIGTNAGKDQS